MSQYGYHDRCRISLVDNQSEQTGHIFSWLKIWPLKSAANILPLNFLVAVVNTLNTKTQSSKETAEFCFENADVKSICYCKQRMKSKPPLSSECVETKLCCKPCTSFIWHLHSLCRMVWYRTSRVYYIALWGRTPVILAKPESMKFSEVLSYKWLYQKLTMLKNQNQPNKQKGEVWVKSWILLVQSTSNSCALLDAV